MIRRLLSFVYGLISLRFVPPRWTIPCFVALGIMVGLALAVGKISRATSYLSDKPETCTNCHVMMPHYTSWQHSSHARVATCNDCHLPQDSIIDAYAFKARDGIYHSAIFTLRKEPQVIRLSSAAIPVVEKNCRRCHEQLIEEVCLKAHADGDKRCWDCHREVPHGRTRSLSSSPTPIRPELPSVIELNDPTIGGRKP